MSVSPVHRKVQEPTMCERDSQFCDVPTAVDELRNGRVLMLVENESAASVCHLAVAADKVELDAINLIASLAGGLPCLAATQSHLNRIQLPLALQQEFVLGAAFNRNNDGRRSIIPMTTNKLGVLVRPGVAECVTDLARLASLSPAGFLCNVARSEGTTDLTILDLAARHSLKVFNIAELVKHRLVTETHIRIRDVFPLKTRFGNFQFSSFDSDVFESCTSLTKGDAGELRSRPPLVRIESLHSPESTCTALLTHLNHEFEETLESIYHAGAGIIIGIPYQRQLSTEELVKTTTMPFFRDDPFSTLEGSISQQLMAAGICSQILRHFNAEHIRVVSNKPRRLSHLRDFGIDIASNVSSKSELISNH